jgi:hypothetical protein
MPFDCAPLKVKILVIIAGWGIILTCGLFNNLKIVISSRSWLSGKAVLKPGGEKSCSKQEKNFLAPTAHPARILRGR